MRRGRAQHALPRLQPEPETRGSDMKRLQTEADRVRRYAQALVTASLTVHRAVTPPYTIIGVRPAVPARWREQLSLTAAAAVAHRRACEG